MTKAHTEKLLNNESLPQLLEPNGIFVLEKRPTETLPETKLWRVASPENIRRNRSAVSISQMHVIRAIETESRKLLLGMFTSLDDGLF